MFQRYQTKLKETSKISEETYEIKFEKPAEFDFLPGQYIYVELEKLNTEDPRGNKRAMSIASPPSQDYLSIIFRTSLSGYKQTLTSLTPGSVVTIEGPLGFFTLPESTDKPLVFIAGGSGIAPYLSILQFCVEQKLSLDITVLVYNKTESRTVHNDKLNEIASANSNIKIFNQFGEFNPEKLKEITNSKHNAIFYIAGPEEMVCQTSQILFANGINNDSIRFDEFYVSQEKQADLEKDYSNQDEILRMAIESSTNHIIITDINGTIFYANKAAQDITGYAFSEMKHQTPRLWGGLMNKDFYNKFWESIKKDRKPFTGEVTNRRKNGDIYYARAKISPIVNKNDELIGFVGTEEDITYTKELTADLEKRNKNLTQMNKFMVDRELDLVEMKRKIKELEAKIEQSGEAGQTTEPNSVHEI